MKKVLVLALCALFLVPAKAVDYCASSSWGYAGTSVTGGGNATPTLVSSVSQLTSALTGKNVKNKVVIITKTLTFTEMLTIQDAQNITIMALPGVKLISNQQTKNESGILFFKRTSNLILRNLTFEGPGAYDVNGNDNLCFEDVTNAWVDHCDFQDGMDGNFDIKGESDNLSVTWCRFRYLKEPKAGGSGGAADHRFSNLVGSGSSDKPNDGTYNITYGFCWWDEGCRERMTRCRNCNLHFLNCYWNSSVANYYVGPENAACYFEGCTFEGSPAKAKIFYENYDGTNGSMFVNCSATKGVPSNVTDREVLTPSYTYDQMTASAAKSMVTNSNCGAGATLTVTNAGAVSSSCDGSDEPVDPEPVVVSDWWNFSDDDFTALPGDITTETTVRGLHIVATSAKTVTIDEDSRTVDTIQFTHRLKLGGTGNASYRHVWFDVTGNCSVTVYLISSSLTDPRTLNIATGSFGNVVSTMTAGSTFTAQTYAYVGDSTRIYLYSANSGINIYGIRLAYPSAPTDIEQVRAGAGVRKIIYNNNVYILREGKTYTLTGKEIIEL